MRYSHIITSLLLTVVSFVAVAQSPNGVESNSEPYRTRLIPYPSESTASARSMTKQRYMQPIEEWTKGEDNTLCGEFTYPFSWVERRIYIRIEQVGSPYEILINGKRAGGSTNGFAAAEYDITKISKEDKNRVELVLMCDSDVAAIECFSKPTNISPIAYIISQPRVRVRDIYWNTTKGNNGVVNVDFGVIMHNETLGKKTSRIYYELYLNDTTRLGAGHRDVSLGMHGVDTMRFGITAADSMLWNNLSPTRLSLRVKNRIEGRDVEFYDIPVALREVEYSDGEFSINGSKVDVSWHEMLPHSSVDEIDRIYADGCRAVRFVAGEVSEDLLNRCDELGIYVAVTAPINSSLSGESRKRGANPSNNPAWRNDYIGRTLQMAYNVMRHPSVIALYLADDSANGICLYESYIALRGIAGDIPVFYDDGGNEWNSASAKLR